MSREGEILPVELELLLSGEPLPGCGVSKGRESELLVLQLLGDGEPLAGAQAQPREVTEVSLRHVLQQHPPGVGTQPFRRPRISEKTMKNMEGEKIRTHTGGWRWWMERM